MADSMHLAATLADRFAIDEVLVRYCRGVNRCDADELRRGFASDATIDFGTGPHPVDGAIDRILANLRPMRMTQHSISNVLIRIDGDQARAETYTTSLHIVGLPGQWAEMVIGGRYLDRLARIDGEWRIAERVYVMDWNRQGPSTFQDSGGLYESLKRQGGRWPDDPSYDWWAGD